MRFRKGKSIRPFIGAKDFDVSRDFYNTLGFSETVLDPKMSVFRVNDTLSFYLQNYYVKDWVDNTMIFLEVSDLDELWEEMQLISLDRWPLARLSSIVTNDWGREFFLHDPSGVLWHIGHFYS